MKNTLKTSAYLNWIPVGISCLLGFLWLRFFYQHIFFASLLYDDSYNASIAKNLATGWGLSTTYHEWIPFNRGITTGPILLLPVALGVFLFGPESWVPHLMTTIVNVILICIFIYRLENRRWLFSLLSSLSLIAWGNETYGSGEYAYLRLLYSMVGEFPSALLVALGWQSLLKDRKSSWIGALILGLAISTKALLVLTAPAFLIYLFYQKRRGIVSLRDALRNLTLLALPLIIFKVLGTLYRKLIEHRNHISFPIGDPPSGSGINYFLLAPNKLSHVISLTLKNSKILIEQLGGVIPSTLLLILTIYLVGFLLQKNRVRENLDRPALWILMAGLPIFIWFIIISPAGWIRYLFPALICWLIFLCLASLDILKLKNAKLPQCIVAGLLGLCLVGKVFSFQTFLSSTVDTAARAAALNKTTDELLRMQSSENILMGCGWWAARDLEYRMPTSLNFKDCLQITDFKNEQKYYLVKSEFWNWDQVPAIAEIEEACKERVLSIPPFTVDRCDVKSLNAWRKNHPQL